MKTLENVSDQIEPFLPLVYVLMLFALIANAMVFYTPTLSSYEYADKQKVEQLKHQALRHKDINALLTKLSNDDGAISDDDYAKINGLYLVLLAKGQLDPYEISTDDYEEIGQMLKYEKSLYSDVARNSMVRKMFSEFIENDNMIDTEEFRKIDTYYRHILISSY